MKYFDVILLFIFFVAFIYFFDYFLVPIKEILKFIKLPIKKLKRKMIKSSKQKMLKNKIDKTKVDRDFVLENIGPYIGFAKNSTEDIYDKDYVVRHNNVGIKLENITIFIENESIRVYNMEIERNNVSFSGYFFDIIFGSYGDLEKQEDINFKIDLREKIKILVLPEQLHIFLEAKNNPFFNITYPIFSDIQNYCNWRQNEFRLVSLEMKKIEGRLFYEVNLILKKWEKEITDLNYYYKETLNKNSFIPRKKILKCREYRE